MSGFIGTKTYLALVLGFLFVVLSVSVIVLVNSAPLYYLSGLLFLTLGCGLLLIWIGNKRMVLDPIAKVQEQALRIATEYDNLGETIPEPKVGELRELVVAFNKMSLALKESYRELERRVSERTEELAKERELLSVTLRSIGEGVISTNPTGIVLSVNQTAEILTGWREREAIGRPLGEVFAVIDEETRQPGEDLVQKVLGTDKMPKPAGHSRLAARDGSERVIENSGAPIMDEDGEVFGVVIVFRDVTEHRRADEELRKREEMLRAILAASPVGILFSHHGKIKWANEAFVRMFGFEHEDEYMNQPTGILHPSQENYEHVRKVLYEDNKCGEVSEVDTKLRRKDGSVFDANIRGNGVGVPYSYRGTIAIISDISEKKKAEDALKASEQRLELAVWGANLGLWDWDALTGMAIVNEQATKIIGYSPGEIESTFDAWKNLLHPEDSERVLAKALDHTKSPSDYYEDDYRVRTESGEWKWIHSRGKIVERDNEGRAVRMTGTYLDITERKKAEKALGESEKRFRSLFENAPIGIFYATPEGKFVRVNAALAEMAGYDSPQQMVSEVNKTNIDELHIDRLKRAELVAAVLKTKEQWLRAENVYRRKDGSHFVGELTYWADREIVDGSEIVVGFVADITDRKEAEERIQKEKDRLKSILDNMNDGVCIVTPRHEIEYVNPVIVRQFGNINDRKCYEYFHGRAESCPWCKSPEVLAGKSVKWERHFDENGQSHEIFESPIENSDGSVSKLEIVHDITDRRRAEEALRKSEEWLRLAQKNAKVGVWELNLKDRTISRTPEFEAIYGLEPGTMLSYEDWRNRVHPEDLPRIERERDACIARDMPFEFEFRILHSSGEIRWLYARGGAIYDEQKAPIRVYGVNMDVTERKRVEAALQVSEARYRMLFDDSKDEVYATSRGGHLIQGNQAYFDLIGYKREELIGRDVRVTYSNPSDRDRFIQAIEAKGFLKDYPLCLRKKDGKELACLITCQVYRADNGYVLGYHGIVRDVTEYKNLQKQLLQAQKMEAVGTLAGGIAHDFNNLLTVITGFSEILLQEKDEQDREYDDLKKIHHSAAAGAELVQQLLMFSRKSEPKPIPMNINQEIVQVEKLLRRTIPKMVQIELNLSLDLPAINADPSQVEQVLMNLSVNARDAMPNGGKLTVRTSVATIDQDYCRTHVGAVPGEYVLLEIRDTGHGMPKRTAERIFEPFFTTKEIGRGTGLGLAMVYGIVRQHNGHITVESEVDKGTSFRVYFPAAPAESPPEAEDAVTAHVTGSETVLLVDDEQFVRELGARILSKHGYTVLQAPNGIEGLELFKKEAANISLVILDLIMPVMGGKECLEELLKIDPQVKVLIASGYSADSSMQETIQMGAKGFVGKPFGAIGLLRDVRRVLDEG